MGRKEREQFINEQLSEIPRTASQEERRKVARMWESLSVFKNTLERGGWMTSPDGEDYCSKCWQKYLGKFNENFSKQVEKDSKSTAELAKTRKSADGWYVRCELCDAEVAVQY
jgi:hypothetical protein